MWGVQVGVLRLPRQTLQALLTKALAREWTPAQAAILDITQGVESVHQAVRRVSLTKNSSASPKDQHQQVRKAFIVGLRLETLGEAGFREAGLRQLCGA